MLVAHGREADPARVVGRHLVALQHVGEELTDARDRLLVGLARRPVAVGVLREACLLPHRRGHLDDERAAVGVVGIAMDLHHAVGRLLDVELEGVEHLVGAQPDVAAVALLESGHERVGIPTADRRPQPVTGDHEVVGAAQLLDVWRPGAELDRDPALAAPVLQDLEQAPARHGGEAVAAAGDHLALEVDVDVVPDGELSLHLGEDHGVGVLDAAERLVAEDHPETEGVVSSIALPDSDLVPLAGLGGQLLCQRTEVEPAGAASDHCDPHDCNILRS